MATLKEAVESGRRWRIKDRWCEWNGPGLDPCYYEVSLKDAISSDFEFEPEPEKPKEWKLYGTEQDWRVVSGPYQKVGVVRVHDADACERRQHCPECGTLFRCPHQCAYNKRENQ